jgi:hypothetical protein
VARRRSVQTFVERRDRLFQIEAVGMQGDEIVRGIAGDRGRPLYLADFPDRIWRDRYGDVGESEPASTLPPNITPAGTESSERVVATNISTELAPGALAETAIKFPLGRPAQPPVAKTTIAATANDRNLLKTLSRPR